MKLFILNSHIKLYSIYLVPCTADGEFVAYFPYKGSCDFSASCLHLIYVKCELLLFLL